jgi:hypothetical protein
MQKVQQASIVTTLLPNASKVYYECILRGSNPRGLCPLGLKSSALTTRPRMRAPAPNLPLTAYKCVAGVMVSIVAFQAVDPGSIPGLRIVF